MSWPDTLKPGEELRGNLTAAQHTAILKRMEEHDGERERQKGEHREQPPDPPSACENRNGAGLRDSHAPAADRE